MGSPVQSGENNPSSSSHFSAICRDCGGSGFRQIPGGVTPCRCSRKQTLPPDPAPAPTPASFRPLARSGSHRAQILAALRAAGPAGVLNVDLYKICLRPPSRLCELRQQGFRIETRREGESIFRFILRAEPVAVKPLPTYESKKPASMTPPLFPPAAGMDGRP